MDGAAPGCQHVGMFAGADPRAARPARRVVPLAVAALAVVAVAVLVRLVVVDRDPAGTGGVRGQVGERMRGVLEQLDPAGHGHTGHGGSGHGGASSDGASSDGAGGDGAGQGDGRAADVRTVCGVRVFGYEPAGARNLRGVRTVYGYHLCGVAEAGRSWDWAVKLSGPLVMDLASDPPRVQVAEATPEVPFRERVRQLIPERYLRQAYQESLDDATMRDLRRRYDAAAGV